MKQSCEERLCKEFWGPGKKRKPTQKISMVSFFCSLSLCVKLLVAELFPLIIYEV